MSAVVRITEFTDPGCPWAFSAEPFRRRLEWLYGDSVSWHTRMVVLSESPEDYLDRGLTPAKQAEGFESIAREQGMPIATHERPRMVATLPACGAYVAARAHDPERAWQLLRCLRVAAFEGALLDERATIDGAARTTGIDSAQLHGWSEEPEVERALREDMAAAREPLPAAHALDHKLGNWSGGRRYTCPSYEIELLAGGVRIAVPGFQPFATYDVVLANLVPATHRRENPDSVEEVLEWAGTPLATKEVAVVCDIPLTEAREQLGRVALERHVGFDGYWRLAD